MDDYLLLAEFDFKKLLVNEEGEPIDDKGYIKQLVDKKKNNINSEENAVERWIKYKYGSDKMDLDDSNFNYPCWHMRAVYNILWGSKALEDYKNGWRKFRSTFIFDEDKDEKQLLMGGDWMNSLQTTINRCIFLDTGVKTTEKDCKEEYKKNNEKLIEKFEKYNFTSICESSGYIGNFCLVPAYFNRWRSDEFWDISLSKLKNIDASKFRFEDKIQLNKSTTITGDEAKNRFRGFVVVDFTRYINTMFLWDYVDKEYYPKSLLSENFYDENYKRLKEKDSHSEYMRKLEDKSEVDDQLVLKKIEVNEVEIFLNNAHWAIKRRSIFMAAMLKIAIEFDKGTYSPCNIKQDWSGWEVSDIYKKIMDKVFLSDKCYSGYNDVFNKIKNAVPETQDNKEIREILKEAKDLILN